MPNVPYERSFQGLFKTCKLSHLSIPKTEKKARKRPGPPSETESYTGNNMKSGNYCNFIYPAFFEPVSAALLPLKTVVIAPVWVMIQLEAFLTQLL